MLTAHRTGELHKVAGDLAQEACYPVLRCPRRLGHWAPLGHSLTVWQVERQADDFQRLKERALESLLRMKRAGKLEDLAEEIRCSSTFILALLHVARVFRNDTCGLRVCVCVCGQEMRRGSGSQAGTGTAAAARNADTAARKQQVQLCRDLKRHGRGMIPS